MNSLPVSCIALLSSVELPLHPAVQHFSSLDYDELIHQLEEKAMYVAQSAALLRSWDLCKEIDYRVEKTVNKVVNHLEADFLDIRPWKEGSKHRQRLTEQRKRKPFFDPFGKCK